MSVILCKRNEQLRKKIEDSAETLKTEAHTLEVGRRATDIVRTTRIERAGAVQRESAPTAIRRS